MTEKSGNETTQKVIDFMSDKHASKDVIVHNVEGGYSRNRRAIIEIGDTSVFAKEVDLDLLPDDGVVELAWLKKDYEVATTLREQGVEVVPEWEELHMDGQLLLMPSYKKEDGWVWSLPSDVAKQTPYIQAVIDATKQLELVQLPEDLIEKLSLQPYFRDELAFFEGINTIREDMDVRTQLFENYERLKQEDVTRAAIYDEMIATLHDDDKLKELSQETLKLAEEPNDCFNHCDVRSDNIAYNERTGEIKFVDWNWASYAPAKFGATEFLVDMARNGVDVTRWFNDMNPQLLAATVGFYLIPSLKEPLAPGSTLRTMQAQTAAMANHLYNRQKALLS